MAMDAKITEQVRSRYEAGAQNREEALCCPVDYDPKYLKVIPSEVIERDYGCGDPSRYVLEGETVLDLGSGTGKICFIASQVTGPRGRVIGVDMTADMLALARESAPVVAERIGYGNVEFRRGFIQDLRTDPDWLDSYLSENPVTDFSSFQRMERALGDQRLNAPLVADESVDIIVSNCVLNLVSDTEKKNLFGEIFRVLKSGGRVAVSDIVSDRPSPRHLKDDPELWSGCISGALQEQEFLDALKDAGFQDVAIDKRDAEPWQVVEGIEYRAMTVVAGKGDGWKTPQHLDAVPRAAGKCC